MDVTEVRISPAKGGKVRAFASVVFDDCFIVNDLRVIEGRDGQVFVTMPGRKTRNGQMRDIAHPLNSDTRQMIEETVLAEYESALATRIVGDRNTQGTHGKEKKQSILDRLATKLFDEEFWVSEVPGRDGPKG